MKSNSLRDSCFAQPGNKMFSVSCSSEPFLRCKSTGGEVWTPSENLSCIIPCAFRHGCEGAARRQIGLHPKRHIGRSCKRRNCLFIPVCHEMRDTNHRPVPCGFKEWVELLCLFKTRYTFVRLSTINKQLSHPSDQQRPIWVELKGSQVLIILYVRL